MSILLRSRISTRGLLRCYSSFTPASPLTTKDLNELTLKTKYAVRGKIPIRADEILTQLKSGGDFPFDKIISANIGNPQQLDQKPLTWYRQVLALLQYPDMIEKSGDIFPKDVITRAKSILLSVGSVGAYSHSQGDVFFRNSVAEFISKRDGYPANAQDIFLTGGASQAVAYLLQVLSTNELSGFLIPIPQYPLYTATIALNNLTPIGYYLDEANNWSTNPESIRALIKENLAKGINIKCLVVINPGNPTGAILSEADIKSIIDIAAEYGIVLIADEVYQENVFEGEFVSMKKVLSQLINENPDLYSNVQLASLHSTSKGVSGECGQRGGYMELTGFTTPVKEIIFKLASINLCSVVSGQALMELMINPPQPGDESFELYNQETSSIHQDLQSRSQLLFEAFQKMDYVSCNKPMGAMYLFPKLEFSPATFPKLFEKAESLENTIDEFYCIELLEATGICCVPGSGFGQVPGTYHLRTTFLPPGSEWINSWSQFHAGFINKYK